MKTILEKVQEINKGSSYEIAETIKYFMKLQNLTVNDIEFKIGKRKSKKTITSFYIYENGEQKKVFVNKK